MNGLEIKNLNVSLNSFRLKNINLTIPKGTIYGLVGKNGAGKSTLIKTIASFIQRDSGEILYRGVGMEENQVLVKNDLGIVFDQSYFNEFKSIKDIRKEYIRIFDRFDKDFFDKNIKSFNIEVKKDLKTLSQGELKKVLILLTMSLKPKILILDEPTSGIDPVSRNEILSMFQEFVEDESRCILFSTHITSDLDKIVDYVAFIHEGTIILNDRKDILEENYRFINLNLDDKKSISKLIGPVKTNLGYEGIIGFRDLDENRGRVPTIEELLIHLTRSQEVL